ncbi:MULTISPECIES: hypothetical protein [Bradyrhizobium]|uniref:hypothetical protein n=1 Tax=Bradyrhizobium TaxID=374 RepID=UPI0004853586|nr:MULTISPECIES: hypothetical protein [Bradyrhizobium]UFW46515.1 hypothetical protein BaraCB756_30015 [Bradyrhizobium arachidis]
MPDTRWRPSSVLLTASGVLLIGVGIYFLFLRPPLLPEDIRYMSLTPAELQSIGPRLASWLTHVFRVMGGYIGATGVLALTLAWTSFRDHRAAAAVGAAIAGGLSIGLMAAVNFMIHSDFKWVLLAMALVWAASIAMFVREAAGSPKTAAVVESATP